VLSFQSSSWKGGNLGSDIVGPQQWLLKLNIPRVGKRDGGRLKGRIFGIPRKDQDSFRCHNAFTVGVRIAFVSWLVLI